MFITSSVSDRNAIAARFTGGIDELLVRKECATEKPYNARRRDAMRRFTMTVAPALERYPAIDPAPGHESVATS